MKNFITETIQFVLGNWKELIPVMIAALGFIYGRLKWIFTYQARKNVENLEIIKKFFSRNELEKLKKEPKFIQHLTCNSVSFFKGLELKDIEKLININIENRNYFLFFEYYKEELIEIQNNHPKLTNKGKKLIKNSKLKLFGASILFIGWCIALAIFLAIFFPLSLNIIGWFILLILVWIPEAYLLSYWNKIKYLNVFLNNKNRSKKCQ